MACGWGLCVACYQAQLDALSHAIGQLTDRQREVFVAIALKEVPIDVLALKLRA